MNQIEGILGIENIEGVQDWMEMENIDPIEPFPCKIVSPKILYYFKYMIYI